MIKLLNISKSYQEGKKIKKVIASLSFNLEKGEFLSILGPNGCGKTTLLNIICGLENPSSGEIQGMQNLQGQIAYVFQDYRKNLLPWLSAYENIAFPLRLKRVPDNLIRQNIEELAQRMEINFDLKQRVYTLSGGQAQKLSLLRALVIKPKLLILDEPFSALDYETSLFLRETLMRITSLFNLSVIFISHDLEDAMYLADRLIILSPSPTKIVSEIEIPWTRPRNINILESSDFSRKKMLLVDMLMNKSNSLVTKQLTNMN